MAIDGIDARFQAQFATQTTAQAPAEKGTFMGHTVTVAASPSSLLADAAEELGFSVDRTKEFDVSERKQRDKADLSKLERVRLYEELMHKAGKGRKLDRLLESIKKQGTRSGIEREAENIFPDPADAWAALMATAQKLRDQGEMALANEVQAAADTLEKKHHAAIHAGISGALASVDYENLGDTDTLKDLYRTTVGEFSSVNEVFTDIHNKFGDDFNAAMDYLFAAISSDINSETPSMGKAHLESLHGKLGLVRLTQSAYKLCDAQMTRWKSVHGVNQNKLTSMKLLGDIVALRTSPFISSTNIKVIVDTAGAPDIEKEVLFTQDLLKTVREFPVALFDDENGRMKLLSAVQDAVDEVIQREDDWLASMEG